MADNRQYQQRFVEEARKKIAEGKRRILMCLPTGGGKGYCASDIIRMSAAKNKESIFFADQRELVFQLSKQLDRMSVPHRKLMAGTVNEYQTYEDAVSSSYSFIAAKDTLWARAFRRDRIEPPRADLVQIDECHRVMSRSYQKIMDHYKESVNLGWTATPCRADNLSLGSYYEDIVVGATYKELQDLGFLVPVKVLAPDRPDLGGMYGKEYSLKELDKRMNKRPMVGSIVEEWRRNAEGRGTVVFASSVDHSLHIRDEFRKLLGTNSDGTERAEHIDGKMDQAARDHLMERVRDGSVVVLCNYGVAHTGVDIPRWKYMICARPTKSFGLWRQMGGRIQRPFESHEECVIQDHSDNAHRFGYPDEDVSWTLEEGRKAQDLDRTQRNKPPHTAKESEPFECPSCGTPFRGSRCPMCGRISAEKKGKSKDMSPGELKELQRKKVNRDSSREDKQRFWDEQCLGWAIGTGRKVGAAAYRYKNEFGVFPPHFIQNVPRSSQWKMHARDFYRDIIVPEKKKLEQELRDEFEQ
jgi:superfamily II DNA or RNA helicase